MAMIKSFDGEYRFLSNFWPVKVTLNGIVYPTVEHAYQAAKTTDMSQARYIAKVPTPGEAKRYGRYLKLRPNWDSEKLMYMSILLRQKFRDPELQAALLNTGKSRLVEGNTWATLTGEFATVKALITWANCSW